MTDKSISEPGDADGAGPDGTGHYQFVESLPDLIDASEYDKHPDGGLVRLQLRVTEAGVEVLGDAFRPTALEALLKAVGGGPTEQMLCG